LAGAGRDAPGRGWTRQRRAGRRRLHHPLAPGPRGLGLAAPRGAGLVTRFLHLGPDAVDGDRVVFEAAAAHHLGRVLRAAVGDVVQAVDHGGARLSVRLTAIAARRVEGLIVSCAPLATDSPLDLTL